MIRNRASQSRRAASRSETALEEPSTQPEYANPSFSAAESVSSSANIKNTSSRFSDS